LIEKEAGLTSAEARALLDYFEHLEENLGKEEVLDIKSEPDSFWTARLEECMAKLKEEADRFDGLKASRATQSRQGRGISGQGTGSLS
jgi:hypothetical protein